MEVNMQRKLRFYLWDYLWWQGEMIRIHLSQASNANGRVYGIVWIYYGSNHHAVVDFIVATFLG